MPAGIGIQLQDKLPNIAIPLRSQDRDVVLELQPIIDACYRDGRYYTTDYHRTISPPSQRKCRSGLKVLFSKSQAKIILKTEPRVGRRRQRLVGIRHLASITLSQLNYF